MIRQTLETFFISLFDSRFKINCTCCAYFIFFRIIAVLVTKQASLFQIYEEMRWPVIWKMSELVGRHKNASVSVVKITFYIYFLEWIDNFFLSSSVENDFSLKVRYRISLSYYAAKLVFVASDVFMSCPSTRKIKFRYWNSKCINILQVYF